MISCFTNSVSGCLQISSGVPYCSMCPSFRTMIRVPSVNASRISCVISGDFVDGFERFVYEQDVRIGGQSACNSHSLALSSGEFRGITVGHFLFRTDDSDESFCGFGGRESVGDYYRQFMAALKQIDVPARIDVKSQDFYDPVDLDKDGKHRSYQKEAVLLWLDNMLFADRVLNRSPPPGKIGDIKKEAFL